MNAFFNTAELHDSDIVLEGSPFEHVKTKPVMLLVEDDATDQIFFQRYFENSNTDIEFISTTNGCDALRILQERRQQKVVVLTSLNIQGISGIELLLEIRKDAQLRKNPVFIISDSGLTRDISNAYNCGANGYIRKHGTIEELQKIISLMINYCEVIELPSPDFKLDA